MTGGKHMAAQFFRPERFPGFVQIWQEMLASTFRDFHMRTMEVGVNHADYLIPWLQTAFLLTEFPGSVSLRIIDRFIAFGPRALFGVGLMIIKGMVTRLLVAKPERMLEMLLNPARDPIFANPASVLERIEKWHMSEAVFRKHVANSGCVTPMDLCEELE
jgi:hypothetical protein